MDPRFEALVESLEPKLAALLAMAPARVTDLPAQMPERGVYLFSDGFHHLYVGRTNTLRKRIRNHCGASCDHRKAALAFRIARRETGHVKASYSKVGSRAELAADEAFAEAFSGAKQRLSKLDVRFVEEHSPTRQALLEIYVATVLDTPYNDFENH
jgi:GIY-YIG catalytic domain